MDNNKINKISKYILIGFGLLVVGAFINDLFINEPKLREKGKYTIGYIYKYSPHKGGASIYYKFKTGNKFYYSNTALPEGWKKKPEWAVETAISNSDWW